MIEGTGLHVFGDGSWTGDVGADGEPIVHVGGFEFRARADKDNLRYLAGTQDYCSVELINLKNYLVVRDNGECGGMNVRFNGIYSRTQSHPKINNE